MGKQFDEISAAHQKFIEDQKIFFVGSAAEEGRVNISPKGGDALRVLGLNRLVWRNLTGSGNETAGHLARVNRMTVMWASFDTRPIILRCYGTARPLHPRDAEFAELNALFPEHVGARQIYDVSVDLVQSSCGYSVPFFTYDSDRDVLNKWAEDKGPEGIEDYWRTRNTETLDGMPTHVVVDDET